MEAESGVIAVFSGADRASAPTDWTLVHDAGALYSGAEGNELTWLVAGADLDDDGEAAVFAQGFNNGKWMLDRFPTGHHAIAELGRAFPDGVPSLRAADVNDDGMGDLTLLLGYPQTELHSFWGESR